MTKEQLLVLLQVAANAACVHGHRGDKVCRDVSYSLDQLIGMLDQHLHPYEETDLLATLDEPIPYADCPF